MKTPGTIRVSAPGKLFLIGEYAVLEGAPAVLAAANQRARVNLSAADDDRWHFAAPSLRIDDLMLGFDGRLPEDIDNDLYDRLRVFDAVRVAVTDYLDAPLPALGVHIDTGDFARGGHKLGLGSSAATAAALTRALLAWVDVRPTPGELIRLAVTAHRNAQGGTGSGGDVAASVFGGIISYTRDKTPRALRWPPGLTGVAVVSGHGASTTDLVGRVYAYRDHSPAAFDADMARLAALADSAADQLGRADRFLRLAHNYFEALIALDQHAHAGIVSARHHELRALAARYGAVFKSSGAGGGDVGLLFATAETDPIALHKAFETAGADIIDPGLGAPGVRLETPAEALRHDARDDNLGRATLE